MSLIEGVNCGLLPSPDVPPEEAELQHSNQGFADRLLTRFKDEAGDIREAFIEVKSVYDQKIDYIISKSPPDLTVGIGGIPAYWERAEVVSIDTDAVVEPRWMYELLSEEDFNRVPEQLVKERLLFMPSTAMNLQISIESEEVRRQFVPVAILNESFEPIATGGLEILLPAE